MEEFKPTWLYVKKCAHCGLKYFGKTTAKNPHIYKGSGTRWKFHIRKHGRHNVDTIFTRLFKRADRCERFALRFSRINDIVNSEEWANLTVENGISVGTRGFKFSETQRVTLSEAHRGNYHTEETRLKISKNSSARRPEVRAKIAAANTGQKRSEESKARMSANNARARLGVPVTKSIRERISISLTAVPKSAEHRRKLSESAKARVLRDPSSILRAVEASKKVCTGRKLSDEHKRALSFVGMGRKHSEETLKKLRGPKPIKTCRHCGKIGSVNNINRWHEDNCPLKPTKGKQK